MTPFEKWEAAWKFRPVGALPVCTMGGWNPETYDRWLEQGLPADWQKQNFFHEDEPAGTEVVLGTCGTTPFWPRFEVEVLEQGDGYRIERDEFGQVVKRIGAWSGKGIVQHLEWPVRSRADWERLKRERMDPADASRYASLEREVARQPVIRPARAVVQNICGTYRMLWHCFGDVNLSYALYDEPALVHDILQTWLTLQTQAIDRIMRLRPINVLGILEDMSCRNGMMISPAHFREFMLPYYQQLIAHVRQYPSVFGVWVDSDGDVRELIPLLLEAGVNGMCPFEVQAGMDVVALRRQYGQQLVIRGGIDKRVLTQGRDAIDRELDRVLPIFVETAGYFICLDHAAPPEVPLDNYLYFLEKARSYGASPVANTQREYASSLHARHQPLPEHKETQ